MQVYCMLPSALSAVLVAQALCSKALSDKEEWVSMMGRALGPFDGRAHADAVAKGSAAVRSLIRLLLGSELLQQYSIPSLERAREPCMLSMLCGLKGEHIMSSRATIGSMALTVLGV